MATTGARRAVSGEQDLRRAEQCSERRARTSPPPTDGDRCVDARRRRCRRHRLLGSIARFTVFFPKLKINAAAAALTS